MKKIILSALVALIGVSSFAQKKGETTFEGSFGLSINPSTSIVSFNGTVLNPSKQSFTFGMNLELGAGYFFADRWKVAGTVGFDLVNNSETMFTLNPSLSYFVPIVADFYYEPTLVFNFGFGNRIKEIPEFELGSVKYSCFDFVTAFNLLSFEYRVSSNFGLGISACQIGYAHQNLKAENARVATDTFLFDINSAKLSVRYYL